MLTRIVERFTYAPSARSACIDLGSLWDEQHKGGAYARDDGFQSPAFFLF